VTNTVAVEEPDGRATSGLRARRLAAVPLQDAGPGASAEPGWMRLIVRRLVLADLLCAVLASATGLVARVGANDYQLYVETSVLVALAWLVSLATQGSYEVRRIATGTREYQGVIRAGAALAGFVAIVCYLVNSLVGRTFVAIVIPVGIALMVLSRFAMRGIVVRLL